VDRKNYKNANKKKHQGFLTSARDGGKVLGKLESVRGRGEEVSDIQKRREGVRNVPL